MPVGLRNSYPIVVEILLRPGFVGLELTSIIDPLRIANRVASEELFVWRVSSNNSGLIEGAGGYQIEATAFSDLEQSPDLLIVPGNKTGNFLGKIATHRILRLLREGCPVFLLAEAAAEIISGQRYARGPVTTHWENKSILLESYVGAEIADSIGEYHEGLTTSAGMGTTVDLMLHLMADRIPLQLVRSISAILLHDRLRPMNTQQPVQRSKMLARSDPLLQKAVELMEENIENDYPIAHLADTLGISLRSLERKFNATFNVSPAIFFREIRLNKALHLVSSTNIATVDIALSCGLHSATNLSKLFRKRYGATPTIWRKSRLR